METQWWLVPCIWDRLALPRIKFLWPLPPPTITESTVLTLTPSWSFPSTYCSSFWSNGLNYEFISRSDAENYELKTRWVCNLQTVSNQFKILIYDSILIFLYNTQELALTRGLSNQKWRICAAQKTVLQNGPLIWKWHLHSNFLGNSIFSRFLMKLIPLRFFLIFKKTLALRQPSNLD